MKKLKLKKGDRVWAKIPINGTIKSVNQKCGYTILVDDSKDLEIAYYGDDEVDKLN